MATILIIDDLKDQLSLLANHLSTGMPGHSFELSLSGREGVEFAEEFLPDLVITDIKMPDVDGYSVCERLKANPTTRHIPVLLISGWIKSSAEKARVYDAGGDGYLPKPCSREELIAMAAGMLDRKEELDNLLHSGAVLQAQLEESKDRYRRFFEEDLTADFVASRDGTITAMNPSFVEMFGLARLDNSAQHSFVDVLAEPDMWPELVEKLQDERMLNHHNMNLIREDGSEIHAIANLISDFGDDGLIKEVSGYLIDVTEYRRIEHEFRQAQKMESLGQLTGGIAHDFNNHLTSILGFADMVAEHLEGCEPGQADLAEIVNAGERAAKLTKRLLAFGRKQPVDIHPFDLNATVRSMDGMLRQTLGPDVELITMLYEEMKSVLGDANLVGQIIANLCVNARDAMPQGGKLMITTQEVQLTEDRCLDRFGTEPGPYGLLKVSDNGTGIPADVIPHLFDPFFTTKAPGEGTGLGLSTVRGIVKQCGGQVEVTSRPNQGTTFFVYLPLSDAPARQDSTAIVKNTPRGNETILLVEDEVSVRSLAARILERLGYRVYQAGQASEALRLFEQHGNEIDLLFSDVFMPHIGGPELADRLQAERPNLRVLFVSGFTQGPLTKRSSGKKPDRLLAKPFSKESLAQAIRETLDKPLENELAG